MMPRQAKTTLLVLALASSGCAESTQLGPNSADNRLGAWAPDASATILRAELSGLANPTQQVVGDRASWESLWAQVWTGDQAPPLPQVDFVLNSVLAVGLGRRAGLGYSVQVDSVVVHTTHAVLYATELSPAGGCSAPGASSPIHLVHMPGHPPVTDWRITSSRRDC